MTTYVSTTQPSEKLSKRTQEFLLANHKFEGNRWLNRKTGEPSTEQMVSIFLNKIPMKERNMEEVRE